MSYSSEVLADSPSLYWRMNEPSGTSLTDSSGNSNTGTTNFSPTLGATSPITADATAKTITFNAASTQYVSSSYAPFVLNSQRTYELWAKKTAARVDNVWGSGGGSGLISLSITNNGDGPPYHMTMKTNGGGGQSWFYVWPDTTGFHHCVVLLDDSAHTAQLYIDKVSQGTVSTLPAYGEQTQFWVALGSNYFTGSIGEVAVYNGFLSSGRISAHFDAATTIVTASKQLGLLGVG